MWGDICFQLEITVHRVKRTRVGVLNLLKLSFLSLGESFTSYFIWGADIVVGGFSTAQGSAPLIPALFKGQLYFAGFLLRIIR